MGHWRTEWKQLLTRDISHHLRQWHYRGETMPFSSLQQRVTVQELPYKWQTGCRCINIGSRSLCRWSIQKHGSLKCASNKPLGLKGAPHKQSYICGRWVWGCLQSRSLGPRDDWEKGHHIEQITRMNPNYFLYVPCVPVQTS